MPLIGLGGVLAVLPSLQRSPMVRWAPRPALVVYARLVDTDGGPAFRELLARAYAGNTAAYRRWPKWEVRWMAAHAGKILGGEMSARTATEEQEISKSAGEALTGSVSLSLVASLSGVSWDVLNSTRFRTLNWLRELGSPDGRPAIPGVIVALADPLLQRPAIGALESIGVDDPRAIERLVGLLWEGREPESVVRALLGVCTTEPHRARCVEELASALGGENASVHAAILTVLAEPGTPVSSSDAVVAAIEPLAMRGDEVVSKLAARVLVRAESDGAETSPKGGPSPASGAAGLALARVIRAGREPQARLALGAVAEWDRPTADVLEAARDRLRTSTNGVTREWAIIVLTRPAVTRADLRELLAGLSRGDPSPRVRMAAIWAIRSAAPEAEALVAAERGLDDPDADVRGAAVGVLARLADTHIAARRVLCAVRIEPNEQLAERQRLECERVSVLADVGRP